MYIFYILLKHFLNLRITFRLNANSETIHVYIFYPAHFFFKPLSQAVKKTKWRNILLSLTFYEFVR